MNSKQFAWCYLVSNGMAGLVRGYYGGFKATDKYLQAELDSLRGDERYKNPFKERFIKQIKDIGIDWDRTHAPESTIVSQFNGTFSEASDTETLSGTLVLLNGETQEWNGDGLEVKDVFEVMANAHTMMLEYQKILNISE